MVGTVHCRVPGPSRPAPSLAELLHMEQWKVDLEVHRYRFESQLRGLVFMSVKWSYTFK